jgi:membrane-associated phospholipid phosphatase
VSWAAGFAAGTALLIGRDDEIRAQVLESDRATPRRVATKFEPLGRSHVAAGGLGILYLVGRAGGRERAASTAATAFEAYLWTFIVTSAAKAAFGRERPSGDAEAHDFFEGGTIFPSGHTSRSFAVAAVFADRYGERGAFVAYPVAALVGLSTLQQDTHWASDILAGAGLGLAIGKGIAWRHPESGRPDRSRPSVEWQVEPRRGGAALRIAY